MHFPPLQGFDASVHSSMSLQRFPSKSSMYPDEQAHVKEPRIIEIFPNASTLDPIRPHQTWCIQANVVASSIPIGTFVDVDAVCA